MTAPQMPEVDWSKLDVNTAVRDVAMCIKSIYVPGNGVQPGQYIEIPNPVPTAQVLVDEGIGYRDPATPNPADLITEVLALIDTYAEDNAPLPEPPEFAMVVREVLQGWSGRDAYARTLGFQSWAEAHDGTRT